MWIILYTVLNAGTLKVDTLSFDTRNQCIDYVNDPSNSNRLAIEIISKVGFEDPLLQIGCGLKTLDDKAKT